MITTARRLLINIGKVLPFAICLLVLITYAETLFSCVLSDFITYGGMVIPNTPISFVIARLFEYDLVVVVVAFVTSIAIQACKWNLYAILYLLCNLTEKYVFDFEMELEMVYLIISLNIIASGFFVYKGISIYLKLK